MILNTSATFRLPDSAPEAIRDRLRRGVRECVALYARGCSVSEHATQLAHCLNHLGDLLGGGTPLRLFTDIGSTRAHRLGLNAMTKLIEAKEVAIVVAADFDRLHRDRHRLADLLNRMAASDCMLVTVAGGFVQL